MIFGNFGTPSDGAIASASVKACGGVNTAVFRATANSGGEFACDLPSVAGFLTYIQIQPVEGSEPSGSGTMILTDVNTGAKYTFTIPAGSNRTGITEAAESPGHCGVYSGPITCEITGIGDTKTVDIKMFGQAS